MPFYAYVISEEETNYWRFVIVFATRDIADQWWRAIQTAAANNVAGWNTVSRITPQLYTHKPSTKTIHLSITEKNVASHLSSQIFFQIINERDLRNTNIIPTQFTKDHISGKQFYIRSQRDPSLYWYVNNNGTVLLSQDEAPTPFVVELRVSLGFPKPAVLISSDDVVISAPGVSGKGKILSVSDDNGLVLKEKREVFKFGDLIDSIERANSGTSRVFRLYKNDQNRGEVWELV